MTSSSKSSQQYFFQFSQSKGIADGWASCADCNDNHKSHADVAHGILLCRKCANFHQTLFPNNSRIVNLTQDKWEPSWVTSMQPSNEAFNAVWEYHVAAQYPKPTAFSTTEVFTRFLNAKYKHQVFHSKNFKYGGKPLAGVFENAFTGTIKVTVKSATDLPKADSFCFCFCFCSSECFSVLFKTIRTQVKKKRFLFLLCTFVFVCFSRVQ